MLPGADRDRSGRTEGIGGSAQVMPEGCGGVIMVLLCKIPCRNTSKNLD